MIRASLILFGIFFDLTACLLIAVGIALLWRGTPFDLIWLVAPEREWALMPYRMWLGPLFLLLALPAAAGSYGMFQRRPWAQNLAVAVFAAFGAGAVMQIVLGRVVEGTAGAVIATLLVLYLTRKSVRAAFGPQAVAAS